MTNAVIIPDHVLATKTPETAVVVSGVLRGKVIELYDRMAQQPEIVDAATFDGMRALVQDASSLRKMVEACRQLAKAPSLAVSKLIDDTARPYLSDIEALIQEGKRQETEFLIERDRKLAEEQARFRAAEAAAQVDRSRPTAPLSQLLPSEIIKAPLTTRRVVVVDNPELVPREYWVLDRVKLDADVLSGKIVLGVRVEEQKHVVAR